MVVAVYILKCKRAAKAVPRCEEAAWRRGVLCLPADPRLPQVGKKPYRVARKQHTRLGAGADRPARWHPPHEERTP
jgi:hypothetical protein